MTRPYRERYKITVSPVVETIQQWRELAAAENRSLTAYLEVMMNDTYNKWRGSVGEQPRPDADRQTDSKQAGG